MDLRQERLQRPLRGFNKYLSQGSGSWQVARSVLPLPITQGVLLLAKEKYRKISDCGKPVQRNVRWQKEIQADRKVTHGKWLLGTWTQLLPGLSGPPFWSAISHMHTPTWGFPLSSSKSPGLLLERNPFKCGENSHCPCLGDSSGQWGHYPSGSSLSESIPGRKILTDGRWGIFLEHPEQCLKSWRSQRLSLAIF